MNPAPSLQSLVDSLGERAQQTALLAFTKKGREQWSYARLAESARVFANRLNQIGLRRGEAIALFAEERPEWVAAALGILRAGGVVVPLDLQFGDDDLAHVLEDSAARAVITTRRHLGRLKALDLKQRPTLILLDGQADDPRNWQRLAVEESAEQTVSTAHDKAVLFYTSGTTGPPKGVPLTHGNIGSQLAAIPGLGVITGADRVLLPLPLHHVYPFVVGMLAPLSLGLPIIFPFSRSGHQLLRAIHEGEATAIVGVPRLYGALSSGITARVESNGRITRRMFAALLALSTFLRRRLRLPAGKIFFRSLHRRFGKQLRLLASGGSALDPALGLKLEALGWQVAIGYGLTETSPLLSISLPNESRPGSVGRAFPGVELRIDPSAVETEERVSERSIGEILARGPNVFSGYRNLPEQTEKAFTLDGWFRTGDLGYFDEENFLHVIGRLSTLIKTGSGEKIQTEDVETAYATEPAIREIGVLAKGDKLVALIVPERAARDDDIEEAIRGAIARASRRLPSYERISDYALTADALPRTRLGKIQRHRLAKRFEAAKSSGGEGRATTSMSVQEMSGEDRALWEDPTAHPVWELLGRRYAGKRLTPDTSLQFDLGVDSLEWLNLTLEVAQASGVEITEEAIARIDTVRDLLREVTEAGEGRGIDPLAQPNEILTEEQQRWLEPLGPVARASARCLYAVGRWLMRLLFRVQAEGLENLPTDRPWVMTPNHLSFLDPFAIAAVLSWTQLRQTYWAGWTGIVSANAFMRFLSRLGKILPIEPSRAVRTGLALGTIVLERKENLIWFPEGERSLTGELQKFKPGIGMLLAHLPRTVIPVFISGTHEALPVGRRIPRLRAIRIRIGRTQIPDELMRAGHGETAPERIADALEANIAALARSSSD